MELGQHMSFVEEVVVVVVVVEVVMVVVVVDCRKFVEPLLAHHKNPVEQKKMQVVVGYRRFVEQLLGPHKSLVEQRLVDYKTFVEHNYLVELMVADCKMSVELLLVLHRNQVEQRKQMLVASYTMFV